MGSKGREMVGKGKRKEEGRKRGKLGKDGRCLQQQRGSEALSVVYDAIERIVSCDKTAGARIKWF